MIKQKASWPAHITFLVFRGMHCVALQFEILVADADFGDLTKNLTS